MNYQEMCLVTEKVIEIISKKEIVSPDDYNEIFIEEAKKLNIPIKNILSASNIDSTIYNQVEDLEENAIKSINAIQNKDIEELKAVKLNAERLKNEILTLKEMLYEDGLTCSYNRKYLTNKVLNKDNKFNRDGVIGIIDLNHLKHINDNIGHNVGDKIIKMLSERLTMTFDEVVRYGGDEFLIFSKKDIKDVYKILHNMRENILTKTIKFGEERFKMTFSFAVSGFKENDCFEYVLENVDSEMYKDKVSFKKKDLKLFNL